jgi:hypothetical protein
MKLRHSFLFLLLLLTSSGCASSVLKGVDKQGQKAYLGPVPLEHTEAYEDYLNSRHSEVDKQNYIFRRLKTPEAAKLSYFHDGTWYTWLDAYRAGNWLIRNRYKKGQDARTFIKDHVWRSEDTGKPHLVKYPDGSIQEAYYVLLNELDLLESTLAKDSRAKAAA